MLQEEKEDFMNKDTVNAWLVREAASVNSIKEHSTLRAAYENYLITKLTPLLGYLISIIDSYSNLDVYQSALALNQEWKSELWLRILRDASLCEISYERMRNPNSGLEKTEFMCQSDWLIKTLDESFDVKKMFKPQLPFFSLLIGKLNSYYANSANTHFDQQNFWFENNKLLEFINKIEPPNEDAAGFKQTLVDYYINDFVLFNCKLNTTTDLEEIRNIIKAMMSSSKTEIGYELSHCIPKIHYLFNIIEDQIKMFLKISKFEPKIGECSLFHDESYYSLESSSNCLQISLDFCLEAVRSRLSHSFVEFNEPSLDRLSIFLQLISQVITHKFKFETLDVTTDFLAVTGNKIKLIKEKYEGLVLLRLFVDAFMSKFPTNMKIIKKVRDKLSELFIDTNESVNFKNKVTIQRFHEFITNSYKEFVKIGEFSNIEMLSEAMNTFYLNTIDCITFSAHNSPDNDAIDAILEVIAKKEIKNLDSFDLNSNHRSLLIQIVFRNHNKLVTDYLNTWYNKTLIGLCGPLFNSSVELATLLQNCIYDQLTMSVSDKSDAEQIFQANEQCPQTIGDLQRLKKIASAVKNYGATFDVSFLSLLAKFKFCTSLFIFYFFLSNLLTYGYLSERKTFNICKTVKFHFR